MKQKRIEEIVCLIGIALIAIWVGILCFYHLGEAGTHNTDEARHIANAYEMFKNHNFWINTYRQETDYFNYKPPLSMWCIMLNFQIGGISLFTARVYSAICMMLSYAAIVFFLWKKMNPLSTIFFGLAFVSGLDLFLFHAARSADADAVYLLCYIGAMLFLYLSEEKPYCMIGCGLCLSLAFMAKCMHIATAIVILLCYLPRLYKRLKAKHWILGGLAAIIPTGIWAVIRLSYDGLTFFRGMISQEVTGKIIANNRYFGYVFYFLKQPVMVICLAGILLLAIINKSFSLKKLVKSRLYLFVLWAVVPFVIYSASGSFTEWYVYTCFFPVYILFAVGFSELFQVRKWTAVKALFSVALGICVIVQARQAVIKLSTLRYTCNVDIREDMQSLIADHPEYRGSRIYLENSRQEYNLQNEWEQNCVADAYLAGDLQPINGGVPLFVEDKDALLIISKDLFETYSNTLAGRVILVDGNDYLIFSNDFY
ncbi:putative uncharacterized protein [Firmicutes bacterium CAG:534]|nr:putative uncharacterized protein [Firmicutes bacterium CAG:534]